MKSVLHLWRICLVSDKCCALLAPVSIDTQLRTKGIAMSTAAAFHHGFTYWAARPFVTAEYPSVTSVSRI